MISSGLSLVLVLVAFALLVGAVVGSLVPQVPGALLSLAGVLLYRYATGEPGTLLLAGLVFVAVLTWVVDVAGGAVAARGGGAANRTAVAARVGGASNLTAVVAGLVGLVLFFLTGPLGIILGVTATVFLVEFRRQQDARKGAKAALVTTVGMLASGVVQALLTGAILVTMVVVALL